MTTTENKEVLRLIDLNEGDEFRFKEDGKRYDVIEKNETEIFYRQLTDYSNRVFKAVIEKSKTKVIKLH